MLSKTTKNCWKGSKYSSLIARPSFNAESMTFLMQRLEMFKRFNLSIFHWASRLLSGGELELNVRTKSFPKLSSSLSSSSKFADAILVCFYRSPSLTKRIAASENQKILLTVRIKPVFRSELWPPKIHAQIQYCHTNRAKGAKGATRITNYGGP